MDPEEEEQRPGKSLAQQVFEAKVRLAVEALKKANMDLFEQTVPLIKADIDDLDDNVIAVREKWKLKAELSDDRCLMQMAPDTREKLLGEMAPLMQWRNIAGMSEALRFDLQMINAQLVKLLQPDMVEKEVLSLMQKITTLSMHLNDVRQHAETIAKVQETGFWNDTDFAEMEQVRKTLRPVIHLRDKGVAPPPPKPPIIDIKEDAAEYRTDEIKTDIRTVDYEIYRQEVEKTLSPLFESDDVLKKIRAGESVTEDELAQLMALVHTQNPNVDLATLSEFYPDTTASLDQILRTMIGMNRDEVEKQFTTFLQQLHTQLNSRQQRFIIMLKDHLCRFGSISVDQLYDAPFNQLDDAGLDGVFPIAAQADVIAQFVTRYSVTLGEKQASVETTAP
jgi:type I restriction enzyme R subunit